MTPRALVVTLVASLALGGCVTVLPKSKPAQLYRFGPGDEKGVVVTSFVPSPARRVILMNVQFPRAAAGDGILTTTGDEAAYIGGARWLEPASELFEEDAKAAFADRARSPHGVTLIDHGQLPTAAAALRLDVSRFETNYPRNGGPPSVVVILHATLDRPDGSPLAARDFAADQPVLADHVSAIVAAYDSAVGQVLSALADWTAAATPTPAPAQSNAP